MYPIKRKSDVFPILKEFNEGVKLENGKRVKCL